MKLLYGKFSPFVRKVVIVAHEKNVMDRIAVEPVAVHPLEPNPSVTAINPLGKIPALVLDDGTPLFGATVIAEYLDRLDNRATLFPPGEKRWHALRHNALADGIIEAGMGVRIEDMRPEALQWQAWREGQMGKLECGLDAGEREAHLLSVEQLTIAEIAWVCALGWLDLRFGGIDWRGGRPALADWFARVSQRPAMRKTDPSSQN